MIVPATGFTNPHSFRTREESNVLHHRCAWGRAPKSTPFRSSVAAAAGTRFAIPSPSGTAPQRRSTFARALHVKSVRTAKLCEGASVGRKVARPDFRGFRKVPLPATTHSCECRALHRCPERPFATGCLCVASARTDGDVAIVGFRVGRPAFLRQKPPATGIVYSHSVVFVG